MENTSRIDTLKVKIADAEKALADIQSAKAEDLKPLKADINAALESLIDNDTAKRLAIAFSLYLKTDDYDSVVVTEKVIKTKSGSHRTVTDSTRSLKGIIKDILKSWGVSNLQNDRAFDKAFNSLANLAVKNDNYGDFIVAAKKDKIRESFVRQFLRIYVIARYQFKVDDSAAIVRNPEYEIPDLKSPEALKKCNQIIVGTVSNDVLNAFSVFNQSIIEYQIISDNYKEKIKSAKNKLAGLNERLEKAEKAAK